MTNILGRIVPPTPERTPTFPEMGEEGGGPGGGDRGGGGNEDGGEGVAVAAESPVLLLSYMNIDGVMENVKDTGRTEVLYARAALDPDK